MRQINNFIVNGNDWHFLPKCAWGEQILKFIAFALWIVCAPLIPLCHFYPCLWIWRVFVCVCIIRNNDGTALPLKDCVYCSTDRTMDLQWYDSFNSSVASRPAPTADGYPDYDTWVIDPSAFAYHRPIWKSSLGKEGISAGKKQKKSWSVNVL